MATIKAVIVCDFVDEDEAGFHGHYIFDCPTIKGDVDLMEEVPYDLQDRGLLPVDADIHVGDDYTISLRDIRVGDDYIISLWEGNDSEFISQFGSLEPFNPTDLNEDNEMPEGWHNALEHLWEGFWSK